jgi:hypothetical protein
VLQPPKSEPDDGAAVSVVETPVSRSTAQDPLLVVPSSVQLIPGGPDTVPAPVLFAAGPTKRRAVGGLLSSPPQAASRRALARQIEAERIVGNLGVSQVSSRGRQR